MSSVIYAYLCDPAFTNQNTPLPNFLNDNINIGNISQVGLSYFLDVSVLSDKRDPSTRNVSIPHTKNGYLLLDGEYDTSSSTLISSIPQSTIDALFKLTDTVFFNQSTTASTKDVDNVLISDNQISSIYVPGSLKLPETQVNGTYYDTTGKSQPFTTWSYLICDLKLPSGSTSVTQTFHIFCEDSSWKKNYPNSTIMSVTPPMEFSDLLSLPLNTAQANELAIATNTMNLAMKNFSGPQSRETATGGLVFSLKAKGPNGLWEVLTPWGILYKGQTPSVTQIRKYIRNTVENSGVGTPDQWKARFPDLYIVGRYYLIPFWDNTYSMSDSTIYRGIVKDSDLINKIENLFPSLDQKFITNNVEYLMSPYDLISIGAVFDPQSLQQLPSLKDLHPTYRSVDSDDSSFSYMGKDTQLFSANLIQCLSIFSGASKNPLYIVTHENGLEYIAYSINEIEYVVISPNCYNTAQRSFQ